MKKSLLLVTLILIYFSIHSQNSLKTEKWKMNISTMGYLENIVYRGLKGNDTIPFFKKGKKQGPGFYIKRENKEMVSDWTSIGYNRFKAIIDNVECIIQYKEFKQQPAIEILLTNRNLVPFLPQKAGIKLGVDIYMDKYPDWNNKYFPTLMRNERTHFYGYFQSPKENIFALVSEQPVASWSIDYNLGYDYPPGYWFMGHRLESLNIDLLNQLPLPEHNPQNLYKLNKGETKSWTFSLLNVDSLSNLEMEFSKVANIPLINMDKTSCNPMEIISFDVFGENPIIKIETDKGYELKLTKSKITPSLTKVDVMLPEVGLYKVRVDCNGKIAEGILSAHQTWQWLMEKAREAVLQYNQKASTHAESSYGFYTAFIAQKYFPDKIIDEKLDDRFDLIFNKLYNPVNLEPLYAPNRIQNTSTFIGQLVDRFEASNKIEYLEKARLLADWLIKTSQRQDGAYYNHGTVYTSVIYVAKSVLELAIIEKELGKKDPLWQVAYERHYLSAKKAIDQLVTTDGNFETEGQATFEDGMITCSALQVGMLALLQNDDTIKKNYTNFMLKILKSHNCLTQLRVPDARRRQGTLRFWEAQYDVMMLPNMISSPHGWSGWRAYATYYAYLLTGDEKWLKQTFNAMGAFANLIDYRSGQLRWAFVVDPSLDVEQTNNADIRFNFDDLTKGNPHPRQYPTKKFTIGEQYINMISDWQTYNTQDNDVHEVFKCIGEIVLTNAFIVENTNRSYTAYNCTLSKSPKGIKVIPNEKQITHLHCNLKHSVTLEFIGQQKNIQSNFLDWAF